MALQDGQTRGFLYSLGPCNATGKVIVGPFTGNVYPAVPLDYEATPVLELSIIVSDGHTPPAYVSFTVYLFVIDKPDAPVYRGPRAFSVFEGIPVGATIVRGRV